VRHFTCARPRGKFKVDQEINKAIVQMEQVTQQNAALVEQVTAATLSFEEEAKRLAAAVNRFKIAGTEDATSLIAPVPRAGVEAAPSSVQRTRPATSASSRREPDEWKEF
jgi:methyl-accepting chemotaxis protein